MNEVKRYNANVFFPGCLGPVSREVVLADDAEKLEAEAQALRSRLEAADSWATIASEQLKERDKLREEVAALRARVVVVPERDTRRMDTESPEGWNDCLDELARLNAKAVSEGMLRRIRVAYDNDMGATLAEAIDELSALLDGTPT